MKWEKKGLLMLSCGNCEVLNRVVGGRRPEVVPKGTFPPRLGERLVTHLQIGGRKARRYARLGAINLKEYAVVSNDAQLMGQPLLVCPALASVPHPTGGFNLHCRNCRCRLLMHEDVHQPQNLALPSAAVRRRKTHQVCVAANAGQSSDSLSISASQPNRTPR